MGKYFNLLLKRLTGQDPFASPIKEPKFKYKTPKKIPYVKPKPRAKSNYPTLYFNESVNPASLIMQIVMLIVGINIFGSINDVVFESINTSSMPPGISSMFSMMPIILVIILGGSIILSVIRVRA